MISFFEKKDIVFMQEAINEARNSLVSGNFPVGCVIEYNGDIISTGFRKNTLEYKKNEIDHAEIVALRKLSKCDFRIDKSKVTIYSTLEPCLMCLGAILINGFSRIVFAYEDIMGGASSCDLSRLPCFYSRFACNIISGVLRNESLFLFRLFFMNSRNKYWKNSKLSKYTLNLH